MEIKNDLVKQEFFVYPKSSVLEKLVCMIEKMVNRGQGSKIS